MYPTLYDILSIQIQMTPKEVEAERKLADYLRRHRKQ
jgi:hypothetical protein